MIYDICRNTHTHAPRERDLRAKCSFVCDRVCNGVQCNALQRSHQLARTHTYLHTHTHTDGLAGVFVYVFVRTKYIRWVHSSEVGSEATIFVFE